MALDSIPQLSLGTAALAIFAICAGFVILRGLTRMLVGTLVLCASVWVGFQIWQQAPEWSVAWTGKSASWLTTGLPVVAFFGTFIILRKVTKFVASPFAKSPGEEKPRTFAGTLFRLVFSLVPTSFIWIAAATLIHHAGSIEEVRAYSEKTRGSGEKPESGFSRKLKAAVEKSLPGKWLATLDPMADPSRLKLAKLITRQANPKLAPVIDPQTGQPIPRAIIVDDPEIQNLARDGKFGTLLRHPMLTRALHDPKVRQLLGDVNL